MTLSRVALPCAPRPICVASLDVLAVVAVEVDLRHFELTRAWLAGQLGDVAMWLIEEIISKGDPRARVVASNMLRAHR